MNARALWFIVLGLVIAAVLLALLRPPTPAPPPASVVVQSPAPAAAPASFEFVVKNGSRSAGPETMQSREGEDVAIKVTADQADELHIHGYDLHTEVKPGEPATLYFKATHSGRFEVELHKSNLLLGTLEIQPR